MTAQTPRDGPPGTSALTPRDTALPAELEKLTAADAGLGVSFDAEDQQTWLLYVLQGGSPQVQLRGEGYVEGAEPSDLFLYGASRIWKGTTGISSVQRCGQAHAWMEWLPNRQGYVARHPQRPPDTETRVVKDEGSERSLLVRRSNGNVVQATRELYLLLEGAVPVMMPCSGSFHKFAREWNTHLGQCINPKTGAVLPSFVHRFRLYTVPASDKRGHHWFIPAVEPLGFVTDAEYQAARAIAKIVERGRQRVEEPIYDEDVRDTTEAPGQVSAA